MHLTRVQARALAAVATATETARRSPHDAYAHLAEGEVRYGAAVLTGLETLFDSAAAAHRRALAIDPRLVDARVGLGMAYLAAGEAEAATAELERAVAMAEAHARSFEFLGRARLALDDANGAADAFARAVALAPASAPARAGHAEALCLARKLDEGRRVLEETESLAGSAAGDVLASARNACGVDVPAAAELVPSGRVASIRPGGLARSR